VTKKIVAGACAIKRGEIKRLQLGNIDIARDWGPAPEYVDAMWRMMRLDSPTDLVIATGKTHNLQEFVAAAFEEVGLDWRSHVDIEAGLRRPADIAYSAGDPTKADRVIGWRATQGMREVVRTMVRAEMESETPAAAPSKS
jgi:GDPmannose 4,6-dehydratase